MFSHWLLVSEIVILLYKTVEQRLLLGALEFQQVRRTEQEPLFNSLIAGC